MAKYIWPEITKDTPIEEVKRMVIQDYTIDIFVSVIQNLPLLER